MVNMNLKPDNYHKVIPAAIWDPTISMRLVIEFEDPNEPSNIIMKDVKWSDDKQQRPRVGPKAQTATNEHGMETATFGQI